MSILQHVTGENMLKHKSIWHFDIIFDTNSNNLLQSQILTLKILITNFKIK